MDKGNGMGKFTRQRIRVILWGNTYHIIEAEVCGGIAIHREVILSEHAPGGPLVTEGKRWDVSHVVSGFLLCYGFKTKATARKAAREWIGAIEKCRELRERQEKKKARQC